MKNEERILIDKFLDGTLNQKETLELIQWLRRPENENILKEEVQLYHKVNASLISFEIDKAYDKNVYLRNKHRNGKFPLLKVYRYAAIMLALIGVGILLKLLLPVEQSTLIIPDNQITLELEDGSIMSIKQGENREIQTKDGKIITTQKQNSLYYKTNQSTVTTLSYNTLIVPYGKTFRIQLADRTMVYLNAGTQLKYPKQFTETERRVYLEGEAYFEVAHDENVPFIVDTPTTSTKVLGTSFNVSAYSEEEFNTTVLVEGSVEVSDVDAPDILIALTPGQMALWDKTNEKISVKDVETSEYTSWIQGRLVFENRTFEEMLRVLERTYNVKIVNHYTELNKERFRARFEGETIEQVMETFVKSRLFSYTIKDNTIIIDKPSK